jgi:hypothetical protein
MNPYRDKPLQVTLAARDVGWRNFFSSCAVMSVFGSGKKLVLVLHTYVLRVQYSCGVCVVLVFWFWREIVFGVTYVLSVKYSCALVSVFWLWLGNSSQNENTFLQKNPIIGLLYYDLLANVCIS